MQHSKTVLELLDNEQDLDQYHFYTSINNFWRCLLVAEHPFTNMLDYSLPNFYSQIRTMLVAPWPNQHLCMPYFQFIIKVFLRWKTRVLKTSKTIDVILMVNLLGYLFWIVLIWCFLSSSRFENNWTRLHNNCWKESIKINSNVISCSSPSLQLKCWTAIFSF